MNEQHVIPRSDLVAHEADDECVCRPTPEFLPGGAVYIHHSLDKRESRDHAIRDNGHGQAEHSPTCWCMS